MDRQWTKEEAWSWYTRQPWMIGFNYLPSDAVNSTDMWQAGHFNSSLIRRELDLAASAGFNACRIFIQYEVWRQDARGLKERLDHFLTIASGYGIRSFVILLDDCNFGNSQAYIGQQEDPVPGIHNSRWVSSPNITTDRDKANLPSLEQYIKDIVTTFREDERIWLWDLFNEPGRDGSLELMHLAFQWARACNPVQPLSTSAWTDQDNPSPCDCAAMAISDINGLHCYHGYEKMLAAITAMEAAGRPLICTEWLNRHTGNTIQNILPLLHHKKIAAIHWGLVAGKSQTYLSWNPESNPKEGYPAIWQHDLFYPDGKPYDPEEIRLIHDLLSGSLD